MLQFALEHPLITMIMFWIAVAGIVSIFKTIFGKSCNDEQTEDDD
jgi:hypothetical protein